MQGVSSSLLPDCAGEVPRTGGAFWSNGAHVAGRHRRIAELLGRIDAEARRSGIALVALKGAALHAIGIYQAGERPMADIDLLARDADVDATTGCCGSAVLI